MAELYFGSSLSTSDCDNFEDLVQKGIKTHSKIFQFHCRNPQSYTTGVKYKTVKKGLALLKENKMKTIIHGQYIHKLSVNPIQFLVELKFASKIDSIGVVLHANEDSLDTFIDELKKTIALKIKHKIGSKILIENQTKTKLFTSLDHFTILSKHLTDEEKTHVGVVIDTAHLFVDKKYDIREKKIVDYVFDTIKEAFGQITCIHLNDLGNPNADKHANLFTGYLGNEAYGGNPESLYYIVDKAVELGVPMVTENMRNSDEVHRCQNDLIVDLLNAVKGEDRVKVYNEFRVFKTVQ